MLGLRGRRALVTGASRGVGRATALMLARAGADVGIGYHSRDAEAAQVAEQARALGVRSFAQAADVATPWGAEMLVERCQVELGGLDLFIANAGIWIPDEVPVSAMTDAQWDRTMLANLTSVFQTVRLAARFVSDGGRIVIVSSTAGQRGEAYHADYAASKGALISFTKSVAVELAARDVTVNCVAPGWIDTEMVEKPMAQGREAIERAIPLGRIASADDVAGPIVFLCSALARHVTGEILNVNGGSVLCG
ncbi:SDR family NAD(P)-dependent oxidoreductase [Longimicrobium sp.]|uniref:SDR family NAD(P)-dependent oxidoreductase n=1 Tax=Longimicrobium sp. TaxID=2029185 RepID=UPI003B3AAF22